MVRSTPRYSLAKFLAQTSSGLVEALEKELHSLGLENTSRAPSGVYFESNWKGCYLANLCLRTATRVVLPVLDFPAYQPDDIYHNVLKHDFTKYFDVDQTLAVDASVGDSKIRDRRIVGLKLKDAVVDQFREKYDRRPNVDKENPDQLILLRLVKNQASVSIDTSGLPLFKRGYRKELVDAPLKEHLAAALLLMSNWDGKQPIIDLMCGSGTFLIEAAMIAGNVPTGVDRKKFSFQKFKTFSQDEFQEVLDQVLEREHELVESEEEKPPRFIGYDISGKAVKAARKNVAAAGLSDYIKIFKSGADMVENGFGDEKGVIVANPPYGERLGSVEELRDTYRDLGYILKKEFSRWSCWILSGEPKLTPEIKMKSTVKMPVRNGRIDCRWIRYDIN